MEGRALRLTACLPLGPWASALEHCVRACVPWSTRGSHQAWLRVIHIDEFHCSLSPLIARGNKPVERAVAGGGWRAERRLRGAAPHNSPRTSFSSKESRKPTYLLDASDYQSSHGHTLNKQHQRIFTCSMFRSRGVFSDTFFHTAKA